MNGSDELLSEKEQSRYEVKEETKRKEVLGDTGSKTKKKLSSDSFGGPIALKPET